MFTFPPLGRCHRSRGIVTLAALTLAAAARAGPEHVPVRPAEGWTMTVVAERLPAVDNIAFTADGTLYATLERKAPDGALVRIESGGGEMVLSGLDRPDGLAARGATLYIAEEVTQGRVIEFSPADGSRRVLARVDGAEGIDFLPDGDLLVSEDRPGGRILRLAADGTLTPIATGLRRPEGLCVDRAGRIFVAETLSGRILEIRERAKPRVVVLGLNQPDQIECGADGSLWITEDARPGRLLRYAGGRLETIADGLDAPQGIALRPDGSVYVAEQGRGRILHLTGSE
ncbi:MAG TPA: hypothetical protein VGA00_13405 [Acidiferrobacterales bacterium]